MKFCSVRIAIPVLVALAGQLGIAQHLDVGILGGAQATSDFGGAYGAPSSESKRYTVGPMVDVGLPLHLSFEFDALYRRFGFTDDSSSCCGGSVTRERANSWEFPMILKYQLPGPIHPFVGAGFDPRTVSGTDVSSGYTLTGVTSSPPYQDIYTYYFNQRTSTSYPGTNGVVVSGGVDFRVGHLRFAPQVRYVHLASPFAKVFGSYGVVGYSSNQNEVFGVLGLSWHVK